MPPSQTPQFPRVLVVGGAGTGKKAFASSLLACARSSETCVSANVFAHLPAYFFPTRPRDSTLFTLHHPHDRLMAESSSDGLLVAPLALSTKYYSCTVQICVLPAGSFYDTCEIGLAAAFSSVEAVALLVDAAASAEAVDAALLCAEPWASRAADEGVQTLLLVASKCEGGEAGAVLSKLSSWALDRGFEFVEADARSPFDGAEVREKSGVPRVLEALESSMWSNITRATDISAAGGGRIHEMTMLPESVLAGAVADAGTSSEDAAAAVEGTAAVGTALLESEEALDFDFAALMDEARAVRDTARSGNMTDDQRREAAAAVAMKMLNMMASGGAPGGRFGLDEI